MLRESCNHPICVCICLCQELKTKYEKHYGKDERKFYPKGLAASMWGGAANLERALSTGEATLHKNDNGLEFVSWKEMTSGTETGKTTTHAAKGTKDISMDAYHQLGDILESISWDFHLTTKQESAVDSTGKLPQACKDKVVEAQSALRKAGAEAKLLLAKLSDKEKEGSLSAAGLASKRALSDGLKAVLDKLSGLQTIEVFEKMPNDEDLSVAGLKAELGKGAQALMALAEACEVAKTFVKKN